MGTTWIPFRRTLHGSKRFRRTWEIYFLSPFMLDVCYLAYFSSIACGFWWSWAPHVVGMEQGDNQNFCSNSLKDLLNLGNKFWVFYFYFALILWYLEICMTKFIWYHCFEALKESLGLMFPYSPWDLLCNGTHKLGIVQHWVNLV